MRRTSFAKKLVDSSAFSSIISVISGVCILAICLLAFSLLLTAFDANDAVKSVMSGISLCLSVFAAGFICAKQRRKNGLLSGIACGICIYFITLCLGTLALKITMGKGVFGKLLLVTVIGAAGGVCGVNSKYDFKPSKPKKNRFGS